MKLPQVLNEKIKWETYTIELLKENVYHIEEENDNPSSMYCIVGSEKVLWVDLANKDPKHIEELKQIKDILANQKELIVMITHYHYDHVGQLDAFKDHRILYPKKDIRVDMDYDQRFEFIEDGYQLDLGQQQVLEMIEVPGHTEGSMCVIDKKNELVVTGDAIGSSYVWLFFIDDILNVYEKGLNHLYQTIQDFKSPLFMCGHRSQQFKSINRDPLSPINDPMTMQYVKDMQRLVTMIKNKTALTRPYQGRGHIESDCVYYFEGSCCEIDSFISLMQ